MADKALTDLPDGGAATSGDVVYVVRSGNSRKATFPALGSAAEADASAFAAADHGHDDATTEAAGFISAADKIKLNGVATGANVTNASTVGAAIAGVSQKATPADADRFAGVLTGGSSLFWTTWGNIKSVLKTYFDGIYAATGDSRIVNAVQNSRAFSAGDGLTGGGDLSSNRSFAIDKASNAQVAAGTTNKVLTADLVESASAWSSVGSNVVAINWGAALCFERTASGNITVSNPTNGQPGTTRYLRLLGNNSTQRSISFGNQFTGALPDRSVNNAQRCILVIVCETTTSFTVTEIPAGTVP